MPEDTLTAEAPPEQGEWVKHMSGQLKTINTPQSKVFVAGESDEQEPDLSRFVKKEEPKPEAKPETKVEAKVEAKPEAEENPLESTKGMSPAAGEKFTAIKKSRDEFRTKAEQHEASLKALQAEIEKLKSTPQTQAVSDSIQKQLDEIKKERDELSEAVRLSSVENHPRFKAYFNQKTTEAVNLAKNAVGAEHADKIAKLITLPDGDYRTEKIEELMSELSTLRASRLGSALVEYDKVMQERAAEVAKAGETYNKLQSEGQQMTERQKAEQAAKVENLIKTTTEKARSLSAFQLSKDDTAHNEQVAKNEAFVRDFFTGKAPENVASFVPYLAAEAVHMKEKVIPQLQDELEKYKKQVEGLTASSPKTGSKAGATAAAPADMPFVESFMKAWKN